jgi:nicotinamide-nucleotide amidase
VDREVLPRLQRMIEAQPNRTFRASRLLKTVNLPESHLDQKVAPIARENPKVIFGFRTHMPENHLKLLAEDKTQEGATLALERAEQEARAVLGDFIFGADEETFVGSVASLLVNRKESVAVAESCTGGMVSELLTSVPGSSDFFVGGAVTYAELMKKKWANVPADVLERHGAVSKATAEAMALGAREVAGTTYGLGITGYAGPSGGTALDPIGTVYFGLADVNGVVSERKNFGGDRERVRHFASYYVLNMLRLQLLKSG